MSCLRELLRKDAPWIVGLALVSVFAFSAALLEEGFARLWVALPLRVDALYHTSWILGLSIGITLALTDVLTGTHDYLRHRPVSFVRTHTARLIGAASVLTAGFFVPPLVSLASEVLSFHGDISAGRPAHVFAIWAYQTPAVSAAALGLFAAGAPLHPALRVVIGGCGVFALLGLGNAIAAHGRSHDPTVYVCFHLVAATSLLAASFGAGPRRFDADRAATRRSWPSVACGITVVAAATTLALAGWQNDLFELRERPVIAADASTGELGLYTRTMHRSWRRVDAEHAPIEALPNRDADSLVTLWSQPRPDRPGIRLADPHLFDPRAAAENRSPQPPRTEHRVIDVDSDLLAPYVQIVDAAGAVRFEHRFATNTPGELGWSIALRAMSLLRPPALALISFTLVPRSAATGFMHRPEFDPLLAGRHRPGLLAALCAVAVGAAWLVRRHCVRRGADPATTRRWITMGLLFGVLAVIAVAAIETRRAHATSRSASNAPARPLLSSDPASRAL